MPRSKCRKFVLAYSQSPAIHLNSRMINSKSSCNRLHLRHRQWSTSCRLSWKYHLLLRHRNGRSNTLLLRSGYGSGTSCSSEVREATLRLSEFSETLLCTLPIEQLYQGKITKFRLWLSRRMARKLLIPRGIGFSSRGHIYVVALYIAVHMIILLRFYTECWRVISPEDWDGIDLESNRRILPNQDHNQYRLRSPPRYSSRLLLRIHRHQPSYN